MASEARGGVCTVCYQFIWTAARIPHDAPVRFQRPSNRLNITPARKSRHWEFNWERRHANPQRHQRWLQLLQTCFCRRLRVLAAEVSPESAQKVHSDHKDQYQTELRNFKSEVNEGFQRKSPIFKLLLSWSKCRFNLNSPEKWKTGHSLFSSWDLLCMNDFLKETESVILSSTFVNIYHPLRDQPFSHRDS